MNAVRLHHYGDPSVLVHETVKRPVAGADEILVRVHAAGIIPWDLKIRAGKLKDSIPLTLPFVAGTYFSGVVAALGSGVSGYAIGDAVYGAGQLGISGSYADYVVAKQAVTALKPKSLDHIHSAAVPGGAAGAWVAMFGDGMINPQPGQTILIHAAAGNVGNFALQLAKSRGATVIATASASDAEALRRLGADVVVDYRTQRFEDFAKGIDAVLDTVGGEDQARSWQVLKPGGVLASLVTASAAPPADAPARVRFAAVQGGPGNRKLAEIAALIDQGSAKVTVGTVLPLSQAARAHELAEAGQGKGRIVLEVA